MTTFTPSVARQPYYSHLCDLCQFRGAFTDRKGVIHDIYHCLATDGRHCGHAAVEVMGSRVEMYSTAYLESCKRRGQPDRQYHVARIYLDKLPYLDANLDPKKRTPGRPGKYAAPKNLRDSLPDWRLRIPMQLTSYSSAPRYPEMQTALRELQALSELNPDQVKLKYSFVRFLKEARREEQRDKRRTPKPNPAQLKALEKARAKQLHREQMLEARRLVRASLASDRAQYRQEARAAAKAVTAGAFNPIPEQADHVAREALRKVQQARRRKNE